MRRLSILLGVSFLALAAPLHAELWNYDEDDTHHGPNSWSELSPDFHLCYDDSNRNPPSQQSPIDIPFGGPTGSERLELHYTSMPLTVENTGHSLLVPNFANNKISICGDSNCKDYRLVQFHFHTPSEHTLDDTSYAMEGHFVHMSSSGQLAVVAVMMNDSSEEEQGDPANSVLQAVIDNAPEAEGSNSTTIVVNPNDMLPNNRDFYNYSGSLTTPPCSEGVKWFVLNDSITISESQVNSYENILQNVSGQSHNNRPLQGLNGRVVNTSP